MCVTNYLLNLQDHTQSLHKIMKYKWEAKINNPEHNSTTKLQIPCLRIRKKERKKTATADNLWKHKHSGCKYACPKRQTQGEFQLLYSRWQLRQIKINVKLTSGSHNSDASFPSFSLDLHFPNNGFTRESWSRVHRRVFIALVSLCCCWGLDLLVYVFKSHITMYPRRFDECEWICNRGCQLCRWPYVGLPPYKHLESENHYGVLKNT